MRRTRIKGIANIPQRKKTDLPQKPEDETVKPEDESVKPLDKHEENIKVPTTEQINNELKNIDAGKKIIANEIINKQKNLDAEQIKNEVQGRDKSTKVTEKDVISVLDNVVLINASVVEVDNSAQKVSPVNISENNCEKAGKKALSSIRRRVIKPAVSVQPRIKRADKEVEDKKNINDDEPTNSRCKLDELNKETNAKENKRRSSVEIEKCTSETVEQNLEERNKVDERLTASEHTNSRDEADPSDKCVGVGNEKETATKIEQNVLPQPLHSPLGTHNIHVARIRKLDYSVNSGLDIRKLPSPLTNAGSDSEYPHPPASPNKVNRSRIKAIPRIGYRKISFSASESEDEAKRTNCRTRNDSQSSNIGSAQETIPEQPQPPRIKEYSTVIQRKCKRTEWSRKLAEARREFARKCVSGKPDHKKLTMIDLIFYNPTTNLIKKDNKGGESLSESKAEETNQQEVEISSEKEDDPTEKDKDETEKLSDEENEILAPQIKIGPSGEIIVDEKSLVIENKQTKKDREELEKSKLVDGNSDRPYGVYKKVKRSKDWSHSETLRFYKALSTIGTDFSLMCELFPNRNRRELKMKFKKEEKINQTLIDKAVMQPCSFDFEELKKEVQLEEIERKEIENLKIKNVKCKKNKENRKSVKFTNIPKGTDHLEIEKHPETDSLELERSEKTEEVHTEENAKPKKKQKNKIPNFKQKNKNKKLDILSVLSDDSDSINSDAEESDLVWKPTQTRYGRKIRKRQIYEPDIGIDEELLVPRKIPRQIFESEPAPQEPGSIMMISTKSADGQPVVQIYMVTDKKVQDGEKLDGVENNVNTENLLPIAMIKTGQKEDNEQHGEEIEEEIIENNYTIPAEPPGENSPGKNCDKDENRIVNSEEKDADTTKT